MTSSYRAGAEPTPHIFDRNIMNFWSLASTCWAAAAGMMMMVTTSVASFHHRGLHHPHHPISPPHSRWKKNWEKEAAASPGDYVVTLHCWGIVVDGFYVKNAISRHTTFLFLKYNLVTLNHFRVWTSIHQNRLPPLCPQLMWLGFFLKWVRTKSWYVD